MEKVLVPVKITISGNQTQFLQKCPPADIQFRQLSKIKQGMKAIACHARNRLKFKLLLLKFKPLANRKPA
jgi:hypothetical protein